MPNFQTPTPPMARRWVRCDLWIEQMDDELRSTEPPTLPRGGMVVVVDEDQVDALVGFYGLHVVVAKEHLTEERPPKLPPAPGRLGASLLSYATRGTRR